MQKNGGLIDQKKPKLSEQEGRHGLTPEDKEEFKEVLSFIDEKIKKYNTFVEELNSKSKGWATEKIDNIFDAWYDEFESDWCECDFYNSGVTSECTCAGDFNELHMEIWPPTKHSQKYELNFALTEYVLPNKKKVWMCCEWLCVEEYSPDPSNLGKDYQTDGWKKHWSENDDCFMATNMPRTGRVYPLNKIKYDLNIIIYSQVDQRKKLSALVQAMRIFGTRTFTDDVCAGLYVYTDKDIVSNVLFTFLSFFSQTNGGKEIATAQDYFDQVTDPNKKIESERDKFLFKVWREICDCVHDEFIAEYLNKPTQTIYRASLTKHLLGHIESLAEKIAITSTTFVFSFVQTEDSDHLSPPNLTTENFTDTQYIFGEHFSFKNVYCYHKTTVNGEVRVLPAMFTMKAHKAHNSVELTDEEKTKMKELLTQLVRFGYFGGYDRIFFEDLHVIDPLFLQTLGFIRMDSNEVPEGVNMQDPWTLHFAGDQKINFFKNFAFKNMNKPWAEMELKTFSTLSKELILLTNEKLNECQFLSKAEFVNRFFKKRSDGFIYRSALPTATGLTTCSTLKRECSNKEKYHQGKKKKNLVLEIRHIVPKN